MKKILLNIVLVCTLLPIYSQGEQIENARIRDEHNEMKTLFGEEVSNGGYGALSMGYTRIQGRHAILAGGKGAWIIGHGLGLGIAGYGFMNNPEFDAGEGLYYNLSGGYGAFLLEPVLMSRWPVHLSFPMLAGAGAVASASFSQDLFTNGEPTEAFLEEATLFLVAEPGVELELNLLRWMRLSFFGTYRFTSRLNMVDVGPNALVGWNAGMTLKLGIF